MGQVRVSSKVCSAEVYYWAVFLWAAIAIAVAEGRWFSFLLVFSLVFSGFLGVFFGGFLFFSPGFLNDFKPEKTKENYKL